MKEHGLKEGKFVHIPNGISLEELSKTEPLDDAIKQLIPKDKFIVGYTGTFGMANSLNTILEAASIIQRQNAGIFFVLIGKGPEKNDLIALHNKLVLKNCIILDAIPKNQVQCAIALFSICAIALFSICAIAWNNKPSLYRFGISPNKLFDYMYAGKPIIQAIDAGNDIVRDAACGLTVAPKSPQAIADAILKLYNMSNSERDRLGNNGKQYVLKNNTFEVLAKQYLDAIQPKDGK
ncbi:hypothetical protein FACS1894141_4860 [Spirochaetia bacterium]|nr:hypothetical protein FACS1894141_4860 [Spirochaetia bacterium]